MLQANETVKRTQVLMGTYATITLPSKHKEQIKEGFNLIKSIEMSLSSYNPKAKVFQLNKHKQIQSDQYLHEALIQSIEAYHNTNGHFDITIGSITKNLYHFGEAERIPTTKELSKAQLGIDSIIMDKHIIRLENNITIDLGGIGKGYAVDKVANYYRSLGIKEGVIALSGDIQALFLTPIYIDSPFTGQPFIKLITKHPNTSISTSGTYRRFVKNKKHHHLINPKNRKQGSTFSSITLLTHANNTEIDALATAIGTMNESQALKLLINREDIGYLLIKNSGNILYGNLKPFASFDLID